MKCIGCKKELVHDESCDKFQPNNGGEVRMIFSYGSSLDNMTSIYRGVICDTCAEESIKEMELGHFSSTSTWNQDNDNI